MSAPKVVVLDYGSGNLRSAERALARAGASVEVTSDFDAAVAADGLVVPGVGAFAACMQGLLAVRGNQIIAQRIAQDRPILGICVGMQVLFERGVEHGIETRGCGNWPGTVERLEAPIVPHMGWSPVEPPGDTTLFAGVERERFYFVHSYAVRSWDLEAPERLGAARVTWTPYAPDRFVSAVESRVLSATQFHPEKSGDAGAQVLANWLSTLS